jgi:hypothetical protein
LSPINKPISLIRVDIDLGISENDIYNFNYVRGVGTQFDASFPYTLGTRSRLCNFRFFSVFLLAQDAIIMAPNPTSEVLNFQSDLMIDRVELYSVGWKSYDCADLAF